MSKKQLLLGGGGVVAAANVADVFSTYLYAGNGSTQTITNGIDLAENGGMVWRKQRTNNYTGFTSHSLSDTERGINRALCSDSTRNEDIGGDSFVKLFNSHGFSIGNDSSGFGTNKLGDNYCSWTFRKAPRFFDVVKYTGNGVAGREIAHDLGCDVGMLIVKRTDSAGFDWPVYHRGLTSAAYRVLLNSTAQEGSAATFWDSTDPTDSAFTLGSNVNTNASGGIYIAYLYAHDPAGENDNGEGMIACGSYTGKTLGDEVALGWEPQFIIVKSVSSGISWIMQDSMRGTLVTPANSNILHPNQSSSESFDPRIEFTASGFKLATTNAIVAEPTYTYIYLAIRAPMMVEPESASEVFAVSEVTSNTEIITGFAPDAAFWRIKSSIAASYLGARLTGKSLLNPQTTAASSSGVIIYWDETTGSWRQNQAGGNIINYLWKRAKGFFDVVCYTGNGVAGRTVNHSLGVVPEMIWVKRRNVGRDWYTYHTKLTADFATRLNDSLAPVNSPSIWNDTEPTETVFTVADSSNSNFNGSTYIAYLFATLAGISKVFDYTGNGASQTINCGFSAGARFIIIKRSDSTGDWFYWDSLRGIIAGNSPHLSLNTTAAQTTTDDSIDPTNVGFIVNQVSATNINVNSATYIGYAIA